MALRPSLWRRFVENFLRTRSVKKYDESTSKILVGSDDYGNRYYERKGDVSKSIKVKRFIETVEGDETVVPKIPAHWDSWLRGRRDVPPTKADDDLITHRLQRSAEFDKQVQKANANQENLFPGDADSAVPYPKYDDLKHGHQDPK